MLFCFGDFMGIEEKVVDPHHVMLAGAGASIGYLSSLLWPMYLAAPYMAVIGGILGYSAAKMVQ
ncbi:hypothetical protein HYX08_06960 [Candidatus Woesearchaeota archaeon]|nr:hypothetical protein [Candidatus Woesearchaeota archaeon]